MAEDYSSWRWVIDDERRRGTIFVNRGAMKTPCSLVVWLEKLACVQFRKMGEGWSGVESVWSGGLWDWMMKICVAR